MESSREVRGLIRQANDIYRQVGVTLDIGDRISITNIPQAYVINEKDEMSDHWNFARLVNTHSNTGGLECYFVGQIVNDSANSAGEAETIGLHNSTGLVVSASGDSATLAHEIGHAFGMRDVYETSPITKVGVKGMTCGFRALGDWNGGCLCTNVTPGAERYYPRGTLHCDIIRRMLMNGKAENGRSGVDITRGAIHGFSSDGWLGPVNTGFFDAWGGVVPVHH